MKQFDTIYEQHLKGLASLSTLQDIATKHKLSVEDIQAQLDKGIKVESIKENRKQKITRYFQTFSRR